MRHYEIILIIDAEQNQQVSALIDNYSSIIKKGGGNIHRKENWQRKKFAYPIKKIYKGYYVLFNIECTQKLLDELEHNFAFNDVVLRYLVIRQKTAITSPSVMMIEKKEEV